MFTKNSQHEKYMIIVNEDFVGLLLTLKGIMDYTFVIVLLIKLCQISRKSLRQGLTGGVIIRDAEEIVLALNNCPECNIEVNDLTSCPGCGFEIEEKTEQTVEESNVAQPGPRKSLIGEYVKNSESGIFMVAAGAVASALAVAVFFVFIPFGIIMFAGSFMLVAVGLDRLKGIAVAMCPACNAPYPVTKGKTGLVKCFKCRKRLKIDGDYLIEII